MTAKAHWERFSPEDVRTMSLAFDRLCALTGIRAPSEALAARFAETIVTVARTGERDPEGLASSALNVLRHTALLSRKALHTRLTPG